MVWNLELQPDLVNKNEVKLKKFFESLITKLPYNTLLLWNHPQILDATEDIFRTDIELCGKFARFIEQVISSSAISEQMIDQVSLLQH